MIITYLKDIGLIKVESPEIATFITNIADYSTVTVVGTKCKSNSVSVSYNTTEVLNVNSKFYIIDNILYIRPTFFGSTIFDDNVYKFSIKFIKTAGGYTLIENCAFVDNTYRCRVAAYLENIVSENKNLADSEKVGTVIHILHYALVNGSNCGCNCVEMCEVFNELKKLLDNTQPENTDCGC